MDDACAPLDQGESDVGSPDSPAYPPHPGKSWFGAPYYGCALSAMIHDWRIKFRKPELPFLLVELAAYCNEHGASTFLSWCDQNTSAINATDIDLPTMRLAQQHAEALPFVFVETAADLGSIHPLKGSIHPAAKPELGEQLETRLGPFFAHTSADFMVCSCAHSQALGVLPIARCLQVHGWHLQPRRLPSQPPRTTQQPRRRRKPNR